MRRAKRQRVSTGAHIPSPFARRKRRYPCNATTTAHGGITHLLSDVACGEALGALGRMVEGVENDKYRKKVSLDASKGTGGALRRERRRPNYVCRRIIAGQPPLARRARTEWRQNGATENGETHQKPSVVFRRRCEAGREGVRRQQILGAGRGAQTADPGRGACETAERTRAAACSPRKTVSGLSGTVTSWDTTAGGEGGRGRTWGSGGKRRRAKKPSEVVHLPRAPRGDAN